MKKLLSLLLALAALPLGGCVTGKGYQGLVPGKDVDVDEWTDRIVTPWGHREFVAKGLRTRVNPKGSNPLPPLRDEVPRRKELIKRLDEALKELKAAQP